ncbi:CD276 antigen-like isoform X1 [Colossoma macropomum]|uniref:CD276 antigen-like isoform X1 n=1 Tax=Colossoma macropomum TaxID=42526 RepID=UPI001863AC58|nr:CD276 antigen-like isoform X1 [Colossoma macropomum]
MRETEKFPASLHCLLLLLSGVSSYTEFEISVPSGGQVGVYGQSVVLSCSFPTGGSWDVSSSVFMWQRGLEVVHSFYHSHDQLDQQHHHYANRTRLYHQEMAKGNASLRLDRVTLEDDGIYTCSVSTQIGSQNKSFSLKVAAFYPEPHLHINLLSNGQVDLLLTSQGGYPSPLLQWLMGNMEDITEETQTQLEQDQHTRLYSVKSKLNLKRGSNSSITFILKNQDLGQEIRRNIDLFLEDGAGGPLSGDRGHYVLLGALITLLTAGLAVLIIFFLRRRTQKSTTKTLFRAVTSADEEQSINHQNGKPPH